MRNRIELVPAGTAFKPNFGLGTVFGLPLLHALSPSQPNEIAKSAEWAFVAAMENMATQKSGTVLRIVTFRLNPSE
jgi:hypothetical protein